MQATESAIPGVWEITLDVFGDERGSFREAYQAEKLRGLGVPVITPVQYNVAESRYGTIRGIHAEPWEKYIHLAKGEAFAAIVDFRAGPTFGQVATFTLTHRNALLVPPGCGNSYAVTSPELTYTYLVTEHWSPDKQYAAAAFDDPALAIDWPIPEKDRIVSDKDRANPTLKEAFPDASRT